MTATFLWSIVGPLIGFTIGLFSFKVKTRWCRDHGLVKVCPACLHGLPVRRAA